MLQITCHHTPPVSLVSPNRCRCPLMVVATSERQHQPPQVCASPPPLFFISFFAVCLWPWRSFSVDASLALSLSASPHFPFSGLPPLSSAQAPTCSSAASTRPLSTVCVSVCASLPPLFLPALPPHPAVCAWLWHKPTTWCASAPAHLLLQHRQQPTSSSRNNKNKRVQEGRGKGQQAATTPR